MDAWTPLAQPVVDTRGPPTLLLLLLWRSLLLTSTLLLLWRNYLLTLTRRSCLLTPLLTLLLLP